MPKDVELPWPAGTATGVGSLPYDDPVEACRIVVGELPDLPHVPELPARGPGADMVGRTCALLVEMSVDLQPAGWRLTQREGLDQRRARSLLARDLDALEEVAQGYRGALKVQVAGPWTLAASIERPLGERVLADRGACRDLAQSLAEGLVTHIREVRRRVPGAVLVVQLDEPSLPAVLDGEVPTASGFSRHRPVEESDATALFREVVRPVVAGEALPAVHCCASRVPVGLLVDAGARGLSFDLRTVREEDLEPYAQAVEDGVALFVGAVPSTRPEERGRRNGSPGPTDSSVAHAVQEFWRRLGFGADELPERRVVTPTCGLAGADPDWARTAMELARKAGENLADRSRPVSD